MHRALWNLLCFLCLLLCLANITLWHQGRLSPVGLERYTDSADELLKFHHGQAGWISTPLPQKQTPLGTYLYWHGETRKIEGIHLGAPSSQPPDPARFHFGQSSLDQTPAWTDPWGLTVSSDPAPIGRVQMTIYTIPQWFLLLVTLVQPAIWLMTRRGKIRDPDAPGLFAKLFGLISFAMLLLTIALLACWPISHGRAIPFAAPALHLEGSLATGNLNLHLWRELPDYKAIYLPRELVNTRLLHATVSTSPFGNWYADLTAPLWTLALITGSLPLLWILATRKRRIRRRRRLAGQCPDCGYDLRESPGRCPECGA